MESKKNIMLTLTFAARDNAVIHLRSMKVDDVGSDGSFEILWEDMQEILNTAYDVVGQELRFQSRQDRKPRYFHLDSHVDGAEHDKITIDFAVVLL